MESDRRTRREFCGACSAAGLAALGGAVGVLQACGGGGSPTSGSGVSAPQLSRVNGTVAGGGVQVTIDAQSPLAAQGSAALVTSGAGNFLVARTGADAFTALTAICTHESCTVTGFLDQNYVCPCHGARYSTAGAVLNGPATRALRQYPTQFAGGILTISV